MKIGLVLLVFQVYLEIFKFQIYFWFRLGFFIILELKNRGYSLDIQDLVVYKGRRIYELLR